MNIEPVSSRKLEIRPLSSAVKNVSGIHVNVCRDVENLKFHTKGVNESASALVFNNETEAMSLKICQLGIFEIGENSTK